MEREEYLSDNKEWWIVSDPYNGNPDYELIHLPTRDKGECGSQGDFPTVEAAMAAAQDIVEGKRVMV